MNHMCEGTYWGVKGEGLRHLASRCSAWGGGRVAVAPRARARLVGFFGGHVLARLLSSTGLNLSHEALQAMDPPTAVDCQDDPPHAALQQQQRAASPARL